MDRASDSGSEGWGFESLLAYQQTTGFDRNLSFAIYTPNNQLMKPRPTETRFWSGGAAIWLWLYRLHNHCAIFSPVPKEMGLGIRYNGCTIRG